MTINPSSPEKCLIIGCGDIGQRIARQLAPLGYQITGLRRSLTTDLPYLHYRQGDVGNPEQLHPLLAEGFDVIVISMTPDERSDAGYQRAYVNTCQNTVNGLQQPTLQQKPRLILFVSSSAVYAQQDGSWVDEASPCEPDSFSGKRLLEAEAVIARSGFAYAIVRSSGIYGPGRNRLIEQVLHKRASASQHFTNRIHAEDCAGFMVHLIEQAKHKSIEPIYIATDSCPTPMVEVVSWIASELGVTDFLSADAVNVRGNKRLSNRLMLATGYTLGYKDFRQGYGDMLEGFKAIKNPA